MEISLLYLFVGVCIGALLYVIADSRPFFLFLFLCIAWLPLLLIGMPFIPFFDEEGISISNHHTS
ncbi:hypothetical protein [Lederbergia ruris]|uniref:hypothetical protein n=1 Tax=Lederbergia ruris TaxID=217495 RepID=UPI00130DF595|nr:hypothetical protein [Lederbergia ruris]